MCILCFLSIVSIYVQQQINFLQNCFEASFIYIVFILAALSFLSINSFPNSIPNSILVISLIQQEGGPSFVSVMSITFF